MSGSALNRRVGRLVLAWALPIVVLAVWWVASAGSTSPFFPPLSAITSSFRKNWLGHTFAAEALPSLYRMFLGYLLALVVGIVLGVALGLSPRGRRAFEPLLAYFRSLPAVALLPIFITITGIGTTTKVAIIFFGAVWPVLLNTIDGVTEVDPVLLDAARTFRVGRLDRLRFIVLRAAQPQMFAGGRTALAIAFIVMIASEMVAATNGLGYFITEAQQTFAVSDMWSGIIVLSLLGYLFNALYLLLERGALRWHRGLRGSEAPDARAR